MPTDRQIVDDIVFNMCRMIRWDNTVRAAWERGARLHIEALPGNVLTGLAKNVQRRNRVVLSEYTVGKSDDGDAHPARIHLKLSKMKKLNG